MLTLVTDSWVISCEIPLCQMSLNFTDVKSTLVQVMVWCRQATSHYLNQCWPRSMSPYGVTGPQCVKAILNLSIWVIDTVRCITGPLWGESNGHSRIMKNIIKMTVCFPHKGPVMQSFDVFSDAQLSKLFNKQLSCQWFETPEHMISLLWYMPLWKRS